MLDISPIKQFQMTWYGLNWPPIQLDPTWHGGVGVEQLLNPPPPWKLLKILNCLTQVQTMWKSTLDVSQVLSNHTKPYQTIQNSQLLGHLNILKKFQFWGNISKVLCPMSNVWCLLSNVRSPMSSWSWRSWQFPVYWSLTLKQLHLVEI